MFNFRPSHAVSPRVEKVVICLALFVSRPSQIIATLHEQETGSMRGLVNAVSSPSQLTYALYLCSFWVFILSLFFLNFPCQSCGIELFSKIGV
jgi:hypothetical protein